MKIQRLGGIAAVAFVAMIGSASAGVDTGVGASCGGCSITVYTSGTDYVLPAVPFVPLDLGTSVTTGQVTVSPSGTINNLSSPGLPAGTDINSISFASGNPTSGLYAGSTESQYLSPFGGSTTTTNGGQNYLVAGGTSGGSPGSVTIDYSTRKPVYFYFGVL